MDRPISRYALLVLDLLDAGDGDHGQVQVPDTG
jgi:hypothetical protein